MIKRAIMDTGPLVASLVDNEEQHEWVLQQLRLIATPLIVCEPVLSESMFLLKGYPAAQEAIFGLIQAGKLAIPFRLEDNASEVELLLRKYRDRPISLADACVVRMSEINDQYAVLTLDSDFNVYRRFGNKLINVISPTRH